MARIFHSIPCGIVSFLTGVCIDIDHLVDYYSSHPFTFDLREICDTCDKADLPKLYLVLHSYELVVFFWACVYILGLGDIWKAAAIGFTQHLILDQFTNPLNNFGYIFTYRLMKGFKRSSIFRKSEEERCLKRTS